MMPSPKKKRADRKIRTGPGPSNSTAATSGSRKFKNVSKPLANRRFYLDIKNHASSKKLSEKLASLGGKLELFLIKEVDYVVTDRENFPLKKRSPFDQAPTPSPLPSFCSVSPATTDSPTDGIANKKTRSRAEAMLERVKQQPQKTTGDVLDNALSWRIPVYPLAKFLTWLEKVSNKTETLFKDQNTSFNSSNSVGRGVKILSGSYLKIETGSRPELKQFNTWPAFGLALDRSSNTFPSNPPTLQKNKPNNWNANTLIKRELNCNEQQNRMTRKVGRTAKEASSVVGGGNGYCEICRIHYDQLDSHTVSAQHLKLVTDSAQYSQLDSIILQNNLGPNCLRKSLRIAKSPPPFLPSEMGGRQSTGSAPPTIDAGAAPISVAKNLRLRECSVALGPPSPLMNGFSCISNRSTRSTHRSKNSSPSSVTSYVPQQVNGCGRKSQRAQHQCEVNSDSETDVVASARITDHNLRSRKASSAQTPMTPPVLERLPSPPPAEKLGPPSLKTSACSERAVVRLERSQRLSEERIHSTRSSSERDKSWGGKINDKDRCTLRQKSSCTPEKATSMTTRSCREKSEDKLLPKNEKIRRYKEAKEDNSECNNHQKSKKKEESFEKELGRTKREDKLLHCDISKVSPKDQKGVTAHDRGAKSERSLRTIKERTYYEELESEESSPLWPRSTANLTPKQTSRKKKVSSKPRVTKKRLSVEEKLIEDNKSYYKVEVLNSKLRSTEYFVNQKQAEERLNGDMPAEEIKPVVVRFKKIRSAELALLSDEAESFMFGEPKKEDSDDEVVINEASDGDPISEEPTMKEEPMEESNERLTSSSIKTETDSSSHSDFISVQEPPLEVFRSSEGLPVPIKVEDRDEPVDDKIVEEDSSKIRFSFERPLREPWLDAIMRQRDGTEFYIPMAHKYPKVILPYQMKRRRRKSKKGEETDTVKESSAPPEFRMSFPSSPIYCKEKDRVPRLAPLVVEDDQPRKSPRHPCVIKRDMFDGSGSVISSDNNTLKTSEGLTVDVEQRCHASTLAIMSSIMRRRPIRECADKCINYEEESSLPETIESSGSYSNSVEVAGQPMSENEIDRLLPLGGDRIAESLLLGQVNVDNYEKASCLLMDPVSIDGDTPLTLEPGFDLPLEEIIKTCSPSTINTLDEALLPTRTLSTFHRPQADSCASSDCSDFLGFMEDGQAATKKRKKRRNLTGWPVEKPKKKFKDKELITASPSLPNLSSNNCLPMTESILIAANSQPDTFSPRRRSRLGSKIRPCLSATIPIPSIRCKLQPNLSSSSPPRSSYMLVEQPSSLPLKKKLSRFSTYSHTTFKH